MIQGVLLSRRSMGRALPTLGAPKRPGEELGGRGWGVAGAASGSRGGSSLRRRRSRASVIDRSSFRMI